jgi:Holliday junction DNA helicase RuvA
MSPDDLRMAILTDDAKSIARSPGIGAKTARRLILELKERVSLDDVLVPESGAQSSGTLGGNVSKGPAKEAMEALVQLGYSGSDAGKAVHRVEITEDMDSEAVLKAALRILASL